MAPIERSSDNPEPVDWHKRDEFIDLLAEVERLREALRGVLTGRVILDETDDGQAILLDLSTDPATPVCF